jgi:hypothetical protein
MWGSRLSSRQSIVQPPDSICHCFRDWIPQSSTFWMEAVLTYFCIAKVKPLTCAHYSGLFENEYSRTGWPSLVNAAKRNVHSGLFDVRAFTFEGIDNALSKEHKITFSISLQSIIQCITLITFRIIATRRLCLPSKSVAMTSGRIDPKCKFHSG